MLLIKSGCCGVLGEKRERIAVYPHTCPEKKTGTMAPVFLQVVKMTCQFTTN